MPMSASQAHARAQIAARSRHHGAQADIAGPLADLQQANEEAVLDRHIDAVVKRAPRMTPEQAAKLRRLFNQPADPATAR
jgi:hypothetical protein